MKVGYFETYNTSQPCLNEAILDIDASDYTHIQLGFGAITLDFDINVTAIADQFDMFLEITNVKRVLSIGGWAFSTDPSTYDIFRQAVLTENTATFVAIGCICAEM
jgi:chitinase